MRSRPALSFPVRHEAAKASTRDETFPRAATKSRIDARHPRLAAASLPRLFVDPPLGRGGGRARRRAGQLSRQRAAADGGRRGAAVRRRVGRMAGAGGRGGQEAHDRWPWSRRRGAQEAVPDLTLAFAPIKKGADRLAGRESGRAGRRAAAAGDHAADDRRQGQPRADARAYRRGGRAMRADQRSPSIAEPVKLDALLKALDRRGRSISPTRPAASRPPSAFAPGPATILTGPEGGFTPEEGDAIRAAPGARAISLGPRILRAETAALAAVAAWMAAAGDWRPSLADVEPSCALGAGSANGFKRRIVDHDHPHRPSRQPADREPRRSAVGLFGRREAARGLADRHRA